MDGCVRTSFSQRTTWVPVSVKWRLTITLLKNQPHFNGLSFARRQEKDAMMACCIALSHCVRLLSVRLSAIQYQRYTAHSRRDRTLQGGCGINDRVYQFQSSSSPSSFIPGAGGGSVCEGAGRLDNDIASGNNARPRVVHPALSSSSINDGIGGETGAVDADESAEKIDCDTSEKSTEARL